MTSYLYLLTYVVLFERARTPFNFRAHFLSKDACAYDFAIITSTLHRSVRTKLANRFAST